MITIYGQQLADQDAQSGVGPLPTQLGGTSITIGGKLLALHSVNGSQVSAQVPFELPIGSPLQLMVRRRSTISVPQDLVVAPAQPAVYTQDQSGSGLGVILDGSTGALLTLAKRSRVNDAIVIYCNGLSIVDPPVPTGTPASLQGPMSATVKPVTMTIGGIEATVQFAGLVPGYSDLYQVNATVPSGSADLEPDVLSVLIKVAGHKSPPVTMPKPGKRAGTAGSPRRPQAAR